MVRRTFCGVSQAKDLRIRKSYSDLELTWQYIHALSEFRPKQTKVVCVDLSLMGLNAGSMIMSFM